MVKLMTGLKEEKRRDSGDNPRMLTEAVAKYGSLRSLAMLVGTVWSFTCFEVSSHSVVQSH